LHLHLVELNIADGTYELHLVNEEDVAAELHHAEVEPEAEQPEDPLTFPEPEGKPRSINSYVLTTCNLLDYLACAFTFLGVAMKP